MSICVSVFVWSCIHIWLGIWLKIKPWNVNIFNWSYNLYNCKCCNLFTCELFTWNSSFNSFTICYTPFLLCFSHRYYFIFVIRQCHCVQKTFQSNRWPSVLQATCSFDLIVLDYNFVQCTCDRFALNMHLTIIIVIAVIIQRAVYRYFILYCDISAVSNVICCMTIQCSYCVCAGRSVSRLRHQHQHHA